LARGSRSGLTWRRTTTIFATSKAGAEHGLALLPAEPLTVATYLGCFGILAPAVDDPQATINVSINWPVCSREAHGCLSPALAPAPALAPTAIGMRWLCVDALETGSGAALLSIGFRAGRARPPPCTPISYDLDAGRCSFEVTHRFCLLELYPRNPALLAI
jgi:hypothetical protein